MCVPACVCVLESDGEVVLGVPWRGCGVALLLLELWLEWSWGPCVLSFDCILKARDLVLEVFLAWQCVGGTVTEIARCILLECQFTQGKTHTIFLLKSNMIVLWSK